MQAANETPSSSSAAAPNLPQQKKKILPKRLWRWRRNRRTRIFSPGKNASLARKTPYSHLTRNGLHFDNTFEPEPVLKPYEIRTFRSEKNLARNSQTHSPGKKAAYDGWRRRDEKMDASSSRRRRRLLANETKQAERVELFQINCLPLAHSDVLEWWSHARRRTKVTELSLHFATLVAMKNHDGGCQVEYIWVGTDGKNRAGRFYFYNLHWNK